MAANPGISAQDFLEQLCHRYQEDGADIVLVSYIPVHLILRLESSQGHFADYVGVFIKTMIEAALEAITGDHYRVIMEVQPLKRAGNIPAPGKRLECRDGASSGTDPVS